jgi:hypothetical protein
MFDEFAGFIDEILLTIFGVVFIMLQTIFAVGFVLPLLKPHNELGAFFIAAYSPTQFLFHCF